MSDTDNSNTVTGSITVNTQLDTYVSIVTRNKKVAVEPFPDMSVKTSTQGQGSVKVARIENKACLARLKVVFPDADGRFRIGDEVLVRGDLYTLPFAKEKYELDGTEFILLPEDKVEVHISKYQWNLTYSKPLNFGDRTFLYCNYCDSSCGCNPKTGVCLIHGHK